MYQLYIHLGEFYSCSFGRPNAVSLWFSFLAAKMKKSTIFFAVLTSRFQTILQLLLLHFNTKCTLRFEFVVVMLSRFLFLQVLHTWLVKYSSIKHTWTVFVYICFSFFLISLTGEALFSFTIAVKLALPNVITVLTRGTIVSWGAVE